MRRREDWVFPENYSRWGLLIFTLQSSEQIIVVHHHESAGSVCQLQENLLLHASIFIITRVFLDC